MNVAIQYGNKVAKVTILCRMCHIWIIHYHLSRFSRTCLSTRPHIYTLLEEWCSGAVVQWCNGAVVQWCSGSVVHWCSGAVVQWCSGAVVQWFSGAVVQWCSGAVVQWRSCEVVLIRDTIRVAMKMSDTIHVAVQTIHIPHMCSHVQSNDNAVVALPHITNCMRALSAE